MLNFLPLAGVIAALYNGVLVSSRPSALEGLKGLLNMQARQTSFDFFVPLSNGAGTVRIYTSDASFPPQVSWNTFSFEFFNLLSQNVDQGDGPVPGTDYGDNYLYKAGGLILRAYLPTPNTVNENFRWHHLQWVLRIFIAEIEKPGFSANLHWNVYDEGVVVAIGELAWDEVPQITSTTNSTSNFTLKATPTAATPVLEVSPASDESNLP